MPTVGSRAQFLSVECELPLPPILHKQHKAEVFKVVPFPLGTSDLPERALSRDLQR